MSENWICGVSCSTAITWRGGGGIFVPKNSFLLATEVKRGKYIYEG
jgi:hypothetical protein